MKKSVAETNIEKAIHLDKLIIEEIASQRDCMLPLYELHQMCMDYVELLRNIEMEKELHKRRDH